MPLDPQARAVIDNVNALGQPPAYTISAQEARANFKLRPKLVGPEVAKVENRNIPGPGGDLPVRIYTPEGTGPFPVLAWFHGGGWVVGDLESADATARNLCVSADCVVVSVDYRLAPEIKFPGASDDCYAATVWAANNAGSINGDVARIAVGGDSAGGNLAAAVSLMAADRNGPSIAMQLLVYPVTDRKFDNVSYSDNAKGYMLEQETMRWYWNHYLASDADAANPYAAPQQATSVAGQPPALVITAEFDPLRDEGEVYGKRLQEAGVETTISRYDGMIHGFFAMVGVIDKSAVVMAEATSALKAAFARAAAPSAAD